MGDSPNDLRGKSVDEPVNPQGGMLAGRTQCRFIVGDDEHGIPPSRGTLTDRPFELNSIDYHIRGLALGKAFLFLTIFKGATGSWDR